MKQLKIILSGAVVLALLVLVLLFVRPHNQALVRPGDSTSTSTSEETSASVATSGSSGSGDSNDSANFTSGKQSIKVTTLWITEGQERLYGRLYQPTQTGKKPVVLLSHGFGGNHTQLASYARAFAQRGYLAYAFDFAGGSTDSRSTGSTMKMSVFTEQQDLAAVLKQFRQRADVDPQRIFLVGASQGGVVSALVAAQYPQQIKGMALLYPAFSMVASAKSQYRTTADIPSRTEMWGTPVGKVYFQQLLNFDLLAQMKRYAGPVLIMHGDQDEVVPLKYSRQAAKTYPHAQLKVLAGAGHDFPGAAEGQSRKMILAFLEKYDRQ